jgi:hypothetical protein
MAAAVADADRLRRTQNQPFDPVSARASFRNAEIVRSSPYQEARAWRQRGFFNGLLARER